MYAINCLLRYETRKRDGAYQQNLARSRLQLTTKVEIISKPAENLIYISICKALCKSCVLQIHSTWSVSLNSKEEQALIDFIVMDFACNSCQEQVK